MEILAGKRLPRAIPAMPAPELRSYSLLATYVTLTLTDSFTLGGTRGPDSSTLYIRTEGGQSIGIQTLLDLQWAQL